MDQIFHDQIGKPILNPPKILTLVAENFSFLEDEARFLKATLAIPMVKNLPFDPSSVRLIQIGPIHHDIKNLVEKLKWSTSQFADSEENICDRIESILTATDKRCIVFVNDVSRLLLGSSNPNESRKLLTMTDKLKRTKGHFMVMLYQNFKQKATNTLLRNLEYISDASFRISSAKSGYYNKVWYQNIPTTKTLIPAKIETNYFTCKIGKYYYSPDFLCFYERKNLSKNYDPDTESKYELENNEDSSDKEDHIESLMESTKALVKPSEEEKDATLPYTLAQNPEQSRIFYYPDKDDDIDEDDPDNDLGI